MANKKVDLNTRMNNKANVRGSSLLKASIISTDDLATSLIEESLKKNDNDKNDGKIKEDNIKEDGKMEEELKKEIPTTTSSIEEINDVSFNTGIRKLKYRLENEEDMQKLSYDIDLIIYKTINDVQVKYEKTENGLTEIKYIDKYENTVLLKNVFNEVKDLILKTNMDVYEMNDYFTSVIDRCIHERFKVIIDFGLEAQLSPAEIRSYLTGFVSIDELETEIVQDYITEYMEHVYDIIYNRVDKNTYLINELAQEIIKLIEEEQKKNASMIINESIINAADEKYVKIAKINIENRKPNNTRLLKKYKRKI